jgi:hypothetical protein
MQPAHKGVDDRGTIDDVLRSIDPQVARYLKKPIMVYNKTSVFSGKALLEFERVTEHNINGYLAADRFVTQTRTHMCARLRKRFRQLDTKSLQ